MTPQFDALEALAQWSAALGTLATASAWWRKGSEEEDKVVSEAAYTLVEGVVDADHAAKIENNTSVNLRDHVTIEEIEEWGRDRDLRGQRWRN